MAQGLNSYETITPLEFDVSSIRKIPYDNVLCEYDPRSNDVTKGGVMVPGGAWEQAAARNVVRLSKVIKAPEKLLFSTDKKLIHKSMSWKTEVEILPGDIAVVDHLTANNAYMYTWEGKDYRLVPYSSIDALRRDKKIIPINGNILIKPVPKKEIFVAYEKDTEEKNILEVCHIGKRNTDYSVKGRYDFKYPLKVGQKVVIADKQLMKLRHLEQPEHAKLDGNVYYVCKRWMIEHIIDM